MKLRREKPIKAPMARLTVRLGADRLQALEALADSEGLTPSFIVRHLLNRYLDDYSHRTGTPSPLLLQGQS